MIIGGPNAEIFRPFAESLLGPLRPETLLIANATDRAVGVLCLTMWSKQDCELGAAATGPGWAHKGYLQHVADVVFVQNGCARVTAKISAANTKSIRAALRAGFVYEGTMRRASEDGENLNIYGMLREECKWLRPKV